MASAVASTEASVIAALFTFTPVAAEPMLESELKAITVTAAVVAAASSKLAGASASSQLLACFASRRPGLAAP